MSEPGNELADLLWHDGPALRTPPPPPPFFPPFASTSSPAHDVFKQPQLASTSASAALMRDLRDADADDGDRHDAVPWLHYPDVEAPPSLPTDYCSALLAGSPYAVDLPALRPAAVPAREMPASSHAAVVPTAPAPEHVPKQPRVSGGEGGVMNFTFFSKPLQRPPGHGRASTIPVESTAVQMQTSATNLLRSTPLFSEQRMAWLQPPRASASAPRSTVASAPPVDAALQRIETTATTTTPRLPPEAGAPELPAPATTSSVCSGSGGDRSQLKRRSGGAHQSAEWSVSQDEELEDDDDDGGGGAALRRSAARGTKRTRTAHVHNQSERRRRDRINEKMRALQELIPNCNKIDKASMLEEAIEYLKTLQLQVQMMSMGTGLCVPPMLMPAMQHLQMQMQVQMPMAAAHFASLGAMAGLGFGMPAAQFPCPPMFPAMFGVPSPVPSFPHASASSAAQTTPGGGAADSGDHPHVPVVVAQCDEIQMQRSDHT